MITVKCQFCGEGFEVVNSRKDKAKYCSKECRYSAQKERYAEERGVSVCIGCGTEFAAPKCWNQRYCSRDCANTHKPYNPPKGEDHYAWNGGITKHSGGYIYERSETHPFTSLQDYVFQHRLVVERMIRKSEPDHHFLIDIDGSKYLKPDIEVHHLNEARDDNSEGNLVACTAAGHHAFHHGLKISEDEYWPHTVKPNKQHNTRIQKVCIKCHTEFEVKASRARTATYCSRECMDTRLK